MARDTVAFISYARRDGEAFATALRERLEREEPEITLWQDRARMEGGQDYEAQLRRAIDGSQFVILVMTPTAMQSPFVQQEWRYARSQGVCVCPVKGAADEQLDEARKAMPRWMSQAHTYDLEKEWDRFVLFLKSPCQATRVPFMAAELPASFVPRADEFASLLDRVLDAGRLNPSGRRVVLHGSPGYGKTTLALAVCHDGDVTTLCDGGILWATLGEHPSPLAELTRLYAALTNQRPSFIDAIDAADELSRKLDGKRCLLVIDDVWDAEQVRPFLRGGAEITRLITTRSPTIAGELTSDASARISVGELSPDEAVHLLSARIDPAPVNLEPFREVASRLGEMPLLLQLANAELHEQIRQGETLEGALDWVQQSLDRLGVVAFDREDATKRDQAIAKTVELSLGLLKDKRQRCLDLAIFPEDAVVPLREVAALWGIDEFETRRLALRLNELSLVSLNLATRSLRLHDAMRAYLGTRISEAQATSLHGRLVDSWQSASQMTEYALQYAGYHLAQSMKDPARVYGSGVQMVALLCEKDFREYQYSRGDLAALTRQIAQALRRLATDSSPQVPATLGALALLQRDYRVKQLPGFIFDLARQGRLDAALDRLSLFDGAEREWQTAARLLVAWLSPPEKQAEALAHAEKMSPGLATSNLYRLFNWVRTPSGTLPVGLGAITGGPDLATVSRILERAGGTEGGGEGLEPLDEGLQQSGIAPDASGFIARQDGPSLVAFAGLNPAENTRYLRRYISIHTANRYRYYRNRSLFELLAAVVVYPDASWVRAVVEELVTGALSGAEIDFTDSVPLAVCALRARNGDTDAEGKLDRQLHMVEAWAASLSPLRGKSDSWAHCQRKAVALAEAYAAGLGRTSDADAMLNLARSLPKGFAGFRAAASLTAAETVRVVRPQASHDVNGWLESAEAAAHRIQDHPFLLQTTAMVNAMRDRWFPATGLDVVNVIARLEQNPKAPEFCIVHRMGEQFGHREKGPHTLRIPQDVLTARTLAQVAKIYGRDPEEILAVNRPFAWGLDQAPPAGTPVNITDAEFTPLLAARLAAEALAADMLQPEQRTLLIQKLVPLAAGNATALNTVVARLLLSAADRQLSLPRVLSDMEPTSEPPQATTSEAVIS